MPFKVLVVEIAISVSDVLFSPLSLCCLQVGKARHILCLSEKLMSSDRPDTVLVDPGIFSAGSECSSRSSLGSISLSSSFLSIASIPAGKPLRFTRDVDPVKVKETMIKKVVYRAPQYKNDNFDYSWSSSENLKDLLRITFFRLRVTL